MQRWFLIALLGAVFVGGFVGCEKRVETKVASAAMTVFPEGASPGMIVRVSSSNPLFAKGAAAGVVVGGQRATVVRVVSDTEAEVLVPTLAAGATKVTVTDATGGTQTANLTVLPAHAQQLVLKWKDGKLELVAVHPTAGEPTGGGEVGGEPQLSFDVLNEAGAMVYTAAIPNPIQQRMEIFDGPDAKTAALHREKVPHEVVFAVKVPKLPGGVRIQFFEAPPGIDLLQAKGRETRKMIGEISVPGPR
jgi:hypothetical protein